MLPRTVLLFAIPVFLAGNLGACSSAPKPAPGAVDVKRQAALYAEAGNRFFAQSRYEEAMWYYELALTENIAVYHRDGMAESHNSIGRVHLALGRVSEAETAFRTAFVLAGESGNRTLIARSANNLAELELLSNANGKALELFEEALKNTDEKKDEETRAVIYHNRGIALRNLGRYDEAIQSIEEALRLNTRLTRHGEMAANRYALSSVQSKKGEYDTALEYLSLALLDDQLAENSLGIAQDLYAMGLIRQRAGRPAEAYENFRQALAVYKALGLVEEAKRTLFTLRTVALELDKSDEAEAWEREWERIGGRSGGSPR